MEKIFKRIYLPQNPPPPSRTLLYFVDLLYTSYQEIQLPPEKCFNFKYFKFEFIVEGDLLNPTLILLVLIIKI